MNDFIGDRDCTTHHYACDCREDYFKKLKAENERLKKVEKDYLRCKSLCYVKEAVAEIARLRAELDKLRWIPVEEGLPKKSGSYQVLRKINRYPTTRNYGVISLMWHSDDKVTHWKPIILPKERE